MRPPLGEPWRAWASLAVGILAVTAHSLASVVLSILMKTMTAELGWSRTEFAGAATTRILAMTAMLPVAGQLADRFGARMVLAGGALTVGACVLAMSRVGSLGELLAVSAVMGPGQACIGAVAASALVLRLFRRHQGLAIGLLNGGDNVLNAMVPPVTSSLLLASGWRSTLGVLGAAYLVLAASTAAALRREDGRAEPAAGAAPTERLPWGDRRLWLVCAVYAAIYAWITSLQLHFHAFQTDRGLAPELASRLLSVYLLVGAAGSPLFGMLAERTSARGALVVMSAGLTLSAATVWRVESTSGLVAWALFHGLVNGGVGAVLALVLHECFGEARIGRLLGVAMVACMTATMLGNQASAWVFDRTGSYVPAWQAYAALMVVATGLAVWLDRSRAAEAAPAT